MARVDGFIDDLRLMERVQMRSFEELIIGQKEASGRLDNLKTALAIVVNTLKDHKGAIETVGGQVDNLANRLDHLEAGQQQIIALLTG